jgi:hypothetical protein
MRFWAVALLPHETTDIQAAVARLIAPYDESLTVAPYKKYVSEKAVTSHARRFGIPAEDFPAVAAHMIAHYAATLKITTHFQADTLGIYVMTDTNPDAKYKRWSLNSLTDDVWPVAEMPRDLTPHAVITPEGQWHELFPTTWGKIPTAQEKERIAHDAYAIIDQFHGHLAVRLECHF